MINGTSEATPARTPISNTTTASRLERGDLPGAAAAFVGRERELTRLLECVERAREGSGRVVLLVGEPGIGKTRLAAQLARHAGERGAQVIWGRAWDSGGAPAYWPWVQIIRALVRSGDSATLAARMGPGAAHIAQVVPELCDRLPNLEVPPGMEPERARFTLFDATVIFLKRVAVVGPLVLILDDLHAADTPSLLLLRFLARGLQDERLLVIGTHRGLDGWPAPEAGVLLAELGQEAESMPLFGLSGSDVGRLIADTTGVQPDEPLVAAMHAATGGNPLFVDEIARALLAEGDLTRERVTRGAFRLPLGVKEATRRRLAPVTNDARRLLGIASVVGRESTLLFLQHLSGLRIAAVLKALDELTRVGLLVEVPGEIGRYSFGHALIRDAVYDELDRVERIRLHRVVGEALEALCGAEQEPYLAELARHFLAAAPAGDVEKGVAYAARAGDLALRLLAYEDAAGHFERSLRALESAQSANPQQRGELLLALGEARWKTGEAMKARATFERAAAIARGRVWPEGLARAALGFAETGEFGRLDRAKVRLLEEALDALGPQESQLRATVLARLSMELMPDPDAHQRRANLSREAVEMARRVGPLGSLAFALQARLQAIWGPDSVDESLATATEILELAHRAGDHERLIDGHQWRLNALLDLGDLARADAEIEAHARVAAELQQPQHLASAAGMGAMRALLAGRFDEGEALASQAWQLGRQAEDPQADSGLRHQRSLLWLEQGRLDELEAELGGFRDDAARLHTIPLFRAKLAHVLLVLGHEMEARAELERLAADDFTDLPRDLTWLGTLALAAELCRALGDARRAAIVYELLLPYERRNVMASSWLCFGSAARYLGLLAAALGRWEPAIGHFEVALEMHAHMGARTWLAHTQHDYAETLLTRGNPRDRAKANELRAAAMQTARELGMRGLLARLPTTPERAADLLPTAGVFRREGDYWTIAFGGRISRVSDLRGLAYVARLLRKPDVECHVLDLARTPAATGGLTGRWVQHDSSLARIDDAGAVIDDAAKAAYRGRLLDLREELEEATALNDSERAGSAREEMELLTAELARSIGLGGRDRRAASTSERARVSVTKAIDRAISHLAETDPALGSHLTNTIRTGTFCSYAPEPRAPVSWSL